MHYSFKFSNLSNYRALLQVALTSTYNFSFSLLHLIHRFYLFRTYLVLWFKLICNLLRYFLCHISKEYDPFNIHSISALVVLGRTIYRDFLQLLSRSPPILVKWAANLKLCFKTMTAYHSHFIHSPIKLKVLTRTHL